MGRGAALRFSYPEAVAPLLEARGLSKCFVAGAGSCRASAIALRGVDLRISEGEVVVLAGAPGAGKSTLLLCLAGIVRPDAGYILWKGVERPRVGAAARAQVVLASAGVGSLAVAREAIPARATLLLLDHPLGALVARSRALQAEIATLAERGASAILTVRAPHHAAALGSLLPRVVLLGEGRVTATWRPPYARRALVAEGARECTREVGAADARPGVGGRAGAH